MSGGRSGGIGIRAWGIVCRSRRDDGGTDRIVESLRKVEKRIQELTKRGDGMEEILERLTERVDSLENQSGERLLLEKGQANEGRGRMRSRARAYGCGGTALGGSGWNVDG